MGNGFSSWLVGGYPHEPRPEATVLETKDFGNARLCGESKVLHWFDF
jgi:hypothetical protein